MNILITSAGSQNGANVIKALRSVGEPFTIVACDNDPLSAGLYMADKRYLVPKIRDEAYTPAILKIVKKEKIDVVIPTYSHEFPVFALHAQDFEGKIALSSFGTYGLSDTKTLWKKVAREVGLDVPDISNTDFPLIIKPITGSGSKNQFIVRTQKEYDLFKNVTNFSEKYIEGQEWVVDGMSDLSGKFICGMPRKRLLAVAGGAKKCVTVDNKILTEKAKLLVETLGLVGAWNVQCIEKDGKYYFIDVNNRFPSGGMPLAAASGINMPYMLIQLLRGEKITPRLVYGLTMIRYDDEVIVSRKEIEENHDLR